MINSTRIQTTLSLCLATMKKPQSIGAVLGFLEEKEEETTKNNDEHSATCGVQIRDPY